MTLRSVLAALLAGAAVGGPTTAAPIHSDVELAIPRGAFQATLRGEPVAGIPGRIDLVRGQAIVIRNGDDTVHYFADVVLWPGQEGRKTFETAGEFRVAGGQSCSLAPGGAIVVVVREGRRQ